MNRSSFKLSTAAALILSLGTLGAHATDTDTDATNQAFSDPASGYGTDATDRGGRPSGDRDGADTSAVSILDWLTGLMD